MATNQMRREAAKRKLERQQLRRVEQAKRRQRLVVLTAVGAVVLVVVAIVVLPMVFRGDGTPDPATALDDPAAESTEPAPAPVLGECSFTPSSEPAAKPAPVPTLATAPTSGTVAVTLRTNRGEIGLTLDRAQAPCTVESFLSLTTAGYFDATPCHRMTATPGLSVLQCGDPTGTGTGGPGYTVNDEFPTFLAPAELGAAYPRGLVAMANTGAPNSGGSQFFLVYADSELPPQYTVFGTISEPGLAVLDQIAAGGLINEVEPGNGAPAEPVTIDQAVAS